MGTRHQTYYFISNFVIINNGPAWLNFDEGRVVMFGNTVHFTETHLKDHLGNTRVVFGYKNNSLLVKQVSSYYPFGMNIKGLSTLTPGLSEESIYTPNEYLYNGKMFQDELGLDWLDYGWRMYDAVLGRWHGVDPLAEKYFGFSPFVYCANNPVNLIDPNGMEIKDGKEEVERTKARANRKVKIEQKFQKKQWVKAARKEAKGKSADNNYNRIERSIDREFEFQSNVNEIGAMEDSKTTIYNVYTNYSGTDVAGKTEYGGTNENGQHIININVRSSYAIMGGIEHELVHGYQFLQGEIDYDPNGLPGLTYDIFDEVSAYRREWAFTGDIRMYNANPSAVLDHAHSSGYIGYDNLPKVPININTSTGRVLYHYKIMSKIMRPYFQSYPDHKFNNN